MSCPDTTWPRALHLADARARHRNWQGIADELDDAGVPGPRGGAGGHSRSSKRAGRTAPVTEAEQTFDLLR